MSDLIPNAWGNSPQLDGLDVIDKQQLIGEPFRITGLSFRHSTTNQALMVEVDGERVDGSTFSFNDSSTGVKEQIIQFLQRIDKGYMVDQEGEYFALPDAEKLVVPNGLRVSEYEVEIKDAAKRRVVGKRMARTYYLTTSGERPVSAVKAPVKAAAKPAVAK